MVKTKIAACIILYNPLQTVEANIYTYINEVEKIYLVDNTESKFYNKGFLQDIHSKISLIQDGINDGIAKRLNQVCQLAHSDGFEWLLTMDQDSFFNEVAIKKYMHCFSIFDNKNKVSMFGVNHELQTIEATCNYQKAKLLITSGSIVNLNLYQNIGGFDENLFIDLVDTEYCFKSLQKKYELIKFYEIYMHHAIGTITKQRSIKNLQTTSRSIHSAVRLYYMIRNFLYINEKYKQDFSTELAVIKKDLFHRVKNKLLYNNNRLQTLRFIIKARKDFRQNKMGKQF